MIVEIREPKTPEEFHSIEEIQKSAWGMKDIEVVPYRIIIAIHEAGGCVFIAYVNNEPVGFVLGFPALKNGMVYMHSHQLGVKREYWGKNIGFLLKRKQREFALSKNINLVRWTFDPLISRNAHLNFFKLGCVNDTYLVNIYGLMQDEVNFGLPSDRFYVEWWLDSERVKSRLKGAKPPQLDELLKNNLTLINKVVYRDGIPEIDDYNVNYKDKFLLLEIPSDIEFLKKKSLDLAIEWREKTREIFQTYFKRGYIVTEFISGIINGDRKSFYVLTSESKENILTFNWWELI